MTDYRDATIADGPALDAMASAIWRETFGHSAKPEDVNLYLATAYGPAGKLLRDLADPAIAFHLACESGRIVGYTKVGAPFVVDAEPGAVQLSQLYVVSDRHGSGIAGVLMDWSVAWARSKGARALLLTVWEENHRALAFYKRRGFEQIGEYAFPVGNQIDQDLILRLAL